MILENLNNHSALQCLKLAINLLSIISVFAYNGCLTFSIGPLWVSPHSFHNPGSFCRTSKNSLKISLFCVFPGKRWLSLRIVGKLVSSLSFETLGRKFEPQSIPTLLAHFFRSFFFKTFGWFCWWCFEIAVFCIKGFGMIWNLRFWKTRWRTVGWVGWIVWTRLNLKLTSSIGTAGWCFLSSGAATRKLLSFLFCHSLYVTQ